MRELLKKLNEASSLAKRLKASERGSTIGPRTTSWTCVWAGPSRLSGPNIPKKNAPMKSDWAIH